MTIITANTPVTTVVFGYIYEEDSPVQGAILNFIGRNEFFRDENHYSINEEVTTDVDGRFSLTLPSTLNGTDVLTIVDVIVEYTDEEGDDVYQKLAIIVDTTLGNPVAMQALLTEEADSVVIFSGSQGPQGPAGPPGTVSTQEVVDINDPTELEVLTLSGVGVYLLAKETIGSSSSDMSTTYVYDADGPAKNAPYVMNTGDGGTTRWVAMASCFTNGQITSNLGARLITSAEQTDIATNTTHSSGDGSDHSDVAANTVHATGDGSDHADVATNSTHSAGDGSDHADVATNTTHSSGNGSDHANVATNTTHSSGDGSDHADVATNSTHSSGDGTDHQAAATQLEMETGTEAALRSVSPLRVAQAIAALAPGGTPTREQFFGIGSETANQDGYSVRTAGSTAQSYASFVIPHDFTSLVSCEVTGFFQANTVAVDIDLNSTYAADGEDRNIHQESDTTATYTDTANQMTAIDLSGVLSSIAAGDNVGIHIDHNAIGTTAKYLRIRLRYT